MKDSLKLRVVFYKASSGREPVREWLRELSTADKKTIGEDIKTVQFGWPLGMPLVRKVDTGMWEVRSKLDHRIARCIFTVRGHVIILLRGFVKTTQKIPKSDLELAR